MLILVDLLCLRVASKTSDSTSYGSTDSIADALTQVAKLTLCFLTLSLKVLLSALLSEIVITEQVTSSLFHTADCLIPLTLGSIFVIFGDSTS